MATPDASAAAPSAAEASATAASPSATSSTTPEAVSAAPAAVSEPQATKEAGGSGAQAPDATKESAEASATGTAATGATPSPPIAVVSSAASTAASTTATTAPAPATAPPATATAPTAPATAGAAAPTPPQAPHQPAPSPPPVSGTPAVTAAPSPAPTSSSHATPAVASTTTTTAASAPATVSSVPTAAAAASTSIPTAIIAAKSNAAAATTSTPAAKEPPAVLVPRCSTWFDLSKINPIEKRMLPEFFVNEQKYRAFPPGAAGSSSKTPQLYVKYRNYMVTAYRQQPSVYLTATACRRSLAGDACAILRVHEFLTHWGIINFDVPPHAMPPALHANYALRSVRAPSSRDADAQPIAMLVDSSSSHHAPSSAAAHAAARFRCELCARECKGDGDFFELSAEAKRRATSGSGNSNSNGGGGDVPSNTMNNVGGGGGAAGGAVSNGKMAPGSDGVLTVGAFAVLPGSGICEECFITHAYPESLDAGDFTRVTSAPASAWTQEELDRLLDAVSTSTSAMTSGNNGADGRHPGNKGNDMSCDWNYVAAKVGTKTPEQCLLHFLELPLLNGAVGGSGARFPPAGTRSLRPMTPAGALNASVLDLSELVSQVDPLVAKAAARAAVAAVKQLHTMPVAERERDAIKHESANQSSGGSSQGNRTTDPQDEPATAMSIDSAAQAIVDSGVEAGVTVKTEPITVEADGDVVMADSTADGAEKQKEAESAPIRMTKETVAVLEEAASATTMALVATRAHEIAEETARGPMRELVDQLLENQLQQMELKMKQLSVLEATLAAERDQLARERHELYMERLAFAQEKLDAKQPASGGAAQL